MLAVGFGRVPADLTGEARQRRDFFDQVADANLGPGADIDRLGAIVALGRQ
jgi:hypothetical protein